MHLDLFATPILPQTSKIQQTLQYPNSPSNAKPFKITIHAQRKIQVLTLLLVMTLLQDLHCRHLTLRVNRTISLIPHQLHKPSAPSCPSPVIMMKMILVALSQCNVIFFSVCASFNFFNFSTVIYSQ